MENIKKKGSDLERQTETSDLKNSNSDHASDLKPDYATPLPSSQTLLTSFQERLFHHFPEYRGFLSEAQMQELRVHATSITLQNDCAKVWFELEKNPFLGMHFRNHIDKILVLNRRKTGIQAFVFNGMLFVLGAFWSWIIQEIDTTPMNWFSLFLLGLGPLGERIRKKILHTLKLLKIKKIRNSGDTTGGL